MRQLLRRVDLSDPLRVLVDDAEVAPLPVGEEGLGADATELPDEVDALARSLYRVWYTGQPGSPGSYGASDPGDSDLVEALRAASATREGWERGWTSERGANGRKVVAVKGTRRRALWAGSYVREDGRGGRIGAGVPLRVLHAREAHLRASGFYFAHGSGAPDDRRRLARFYLNVDEENAVAVMAQLTGRLTRFEVPFSYKVVDRRAFLRRVDSSVLYVERRHFRLVAPLVEEALDGLERPLGPATPPLTKRLAPGLGFAEDPGFGLSFGVDRCKLIAGALHDAARRGEADGELLLAAVARAFEQRGLSLERPWLAIDGPDEYSLAHV